MPSAPAPGRNIPTGSTIPALKIPSMLTAPGFIPSIGDIIELKVCANGFLYNMARAMAGTVVYAAEGKIKPEEIGAILDSGNRTAAGPTVPPGGLYMSHLWYDDGIEKFECTPWQD